MGHINNNIISDYFKERPQLKKPKMNQLGFEVPPEWKDFVESLIQRVEKSEPFNWIDTNGSKPAKDNDPYSANRYSVPVVVKNETIGAVWPQFVRWDFLEDGWVEANWCDGEEPEDYEMNYVSHWMFIS